MKNELRILHLGDIHFDSPFSGLSGAEAARRNEEIRRVFSGAMRYAQKQKADIVLLCGDVFDGDYCSPKTAELLKNEMNALPKCRFIISPGNHDPYTSNGVYEKLDLPENCHVFSRNTIEKLCLDELCADIYGYAFTDTEMKSSPLEGFSVSDDDRFNILCAHADVGVSGSNYAFVSESDIATSGLDYAAFGHIHNSEKIQNSGKTRRITASNASFSTYSDISGTVYAYSGCLCGRDYGECGRKGGIFVTLSRDVSDANAAEDRKKHIKATRVTFCPWVYREINIDIGGLKTLDEVIKKAVGLLPNDGSNIKRFLRITLYGRCDNGIREELESKEQSCSLSEAVEAKLKAALGSVNVEITAFDNTKAAFSFSELEKDISIRGAFYRELKPQLESDDPVLARRALRALYMGIAALDGGNPFDI